MTLEGLIYLIIQVAIFALVAYVILWATKKLLAAFHIADPWNTVALVVVVLLIMLIGLSWFGYLPRGGTVLHR